MANDFISNNLLSANSYLLKDPCTTTLRENEIKERASLNELKEVIEYLEFFSGTKFCKTPDIVETVIIGRFLSTLVDYPTREMRYYVAKSIVEHRDFIRSEAQRLFDLTNEERQKLVPTPGRTSSDCA